MNEGAVFHISTWPWNLKYSKEPCGTVVNRPRQVLDQLFYKQNLCPRNWVRYSLGMVGVSAPAMPTTLSVSLKRSQIANKKNNLFSVYKV